ncbi:MAG: hypothetical protein OIF50_06840 [Flavobacteriaceae bacterium]|nr:hypothetical protein [Flavobacteriaceae bacterium]
MKYLKEWYWLMAILIVAFAVVRTIWSGPVLGSKALVEWNLGDTYYVLKTPEMILLVWATIVASVYLVRMFWGKFKNMGVNVIFTLASLTLLIFYF